MLLKRFIMAGRQTESCLYIPLKKKKRKKKPCLYIMIWSFHIPPNLVRLYFCWPSFQSVPLTFVLHLYLLYAYLDELTTDQGQHILILFLTTIPFLLKKWRCNSIYILKYYFILFYYLKKIILSIIPYNFIILFIS